MPEQIMNNLNERMEKAIASLRRELASIRAGKASAAVLDRLTVDYYGVPTPINQVAGVSVPEPKMLVISPYEKTLLGDIEKAIQASDLGLNPANDGTVIRIVFPALTEERRKELAKLVGKESEGAKVAVRNVRRDAMDAMKKLEKASQITEDDLKGYSDDIQKVDPYVKDGIAESALTSVVLPHVKTAKEGVELLAKIVREKGAAEGNIVTIADKTGVWYMEILSGHQYAAIKFPDDKYAVFPNTFFLGSVDKNDTENTILSADLEKIAQDAGTYKEINGSFHVAQSYNPPLAEADRSRVWSGIKALKSFHL